MTRLLIIGSGSHGRIVAEAATQSGMFRVIGFADDDPRRTGLIIDGCPVLGPWSSVKADAYVVAIGRNEIRRQIFEQLRIAAMPRAVIISPAPACQNSRSSAPVPSSLPAPSFRPVPPSART